MEFEITWIVFEARTIAISSTEEAWCFLSEWLGGLYPEMAHRAGIALTRADAGIGTVGESRQAFLDFRMDADILAATN